MRVATDEFVCQTVHHIIEGKVLLVFANIRLEEHLQQNIAQFFLVVLQIIAHHRRKEFVTLLLQTGLNRLQRLLAIPRTTIGGAEGFEDPT